MWLSDSESRGLPSSKRQEIKAWVTLFKVCTRYDGSGFPAMFRNMIVHNSRYLAVQIEIRVRNHPQITGSRFNIGQGRPPR